MKRIFCFLAVMFILIGCGANVTDAPNEKERKKIAEDWVAAANWVAMETRDREAINLLHLLQDYTFVAKPLGGEKEALTIQAIDDVPKVLYPVALLPLHEKDKLLSKAWQREYDRPEMASYLPYENNISQITLKNKFEMPVIRKGLMLLHEAKHMRTHQAGDLREIEDQDDRMAAIIDEYQVYEFEKRLVGILGGEEYKRLVKKSTALHEKNLRKGKADIVFSRPWFSADLKRIFGEQNDDSLVMFEQFLWKTGYLNAVESVYGDSRNGRLMKIQFFAQFYKKEK